MTKKSATPPEVPAPVEPAGERAQQVRHVLDLLREIGKRRSLRDPLSDALGDVGLSPPQVHALMWIGDEERITMGNLARRSGVTEKTVTGIVDRLEQAALAQRERDAADRRVVQVVLTPQGREMFLTCQMHIADKVATLLGLLDPEDRSALFRILEKIKDRMGSIGPGRVASEGK